MNPDSIHLLRTFAGLLPAQQARDGPAEGLERHRRDGLTRTLESLTLETCVPESDNSSSHHQRERTGRERKRERKWCTARLSPAPSPRKPRDARIVDRRDVHGPDRPTIPSSRRRRHRDAGRADRREGIGFVILFRGPLTPVWPQRIYHIEHDGKGSFDLFLVPVGPRNGGMEYEAIFT